MDFFDMIQVCSFVMALMLGPFVVGSWNPVMWILYLGICTVLTPFIGIPIYKTFFR